MADLRRPQSLCHSELHLGSSERGSARSHSVQNWLWKRLRTFRKTLCGMNECTTNNGSLLLNDRPARLLREEETGGPNNEPLKGFDAKTYYLS